MKNSPYESLKLNNGMELPIIGFGTYLSKGSEIGPALRHAIETGYRHIDCAYAYDNQEEVGKALTQIFKEGKVKREDLFITSKLQTDGMDPKQVEANLDKTLGQLKLDYLDLFLIHQPVATKYENEKNSPLRKQGWGLQDVWRSMEVVNRKGKAKAIGVSNFNAALLNDLLCYAEIPPAVLQIERHLFLQQNKLVDFCHREGIAVVEYAPLGSPGYDTESESASILKNETVLKLAKKNNKTASQVLVRWAIDTGCGAIPKSVHKERIKENFDVFNFKLDKKDIEELRKLDKGARTFDQEWCQVPIFF